MTTLLLCLAFQDPRVTLEVKDEPLGVAAVLALAPFGDEALWPEPPLALRRVSFRLKDAGYLEALDTLGQAGGYGRVLDPHHTFLLGPPNECVSFGFLDPPPAALDLSPSVRLLAWASATREKSSLALYLIAPPATPRRGARFEGHVGGHALRIEFQPFQDLKSGEPVRLSAHATLPRQTSDGTFTLEGALLLEDGRSLPVATGPLTLPPLPEPSPAEADPPPPSLGPFLIAGLSAGGLVILLWLRLVSRRQT